MGESVGEVFLELQADPKPLLGQVESIADKVSGLLGNRIAGAFSVSQSNVDMSGIMSILNTISGKLDKSVSSGIEKGAKAGASEVSKAVSGAVDGVKTPKIKVALSKEDLTRQLENLSGTLDNTNAKIYVQEQAVSELRRQWANMGNLGTQDSEAGSALQRKILAAEGAMLKLEGESDQLAAKARAVENAIDNFGTAAKQDVDKVAQSASNAATQIRDVGNAGQSSGRRASSGLSKIIQTLTSSGKSSGSSSIESRLNSIERSTQKTMRAVTALGRRFFVLFTGKLISAAFAGVSESLEDLTKHSDTLKNSMNSLTSSGKTVSNGVITAIAPLINFVAPTLASIADKIRVFSNQVAMFMAGIFGQKTVMQAAASAYDTYGSSASGAAAAAEKANKTLAGFDTLNVLSSSKASSSGSGSGSSGSGATTQWVETPVTGSEWTKNITAAFDKVKPQFQAFYDEVLKPFGEWVMSEGLPGLITFLGNVAQFFAEHPKLLATIVALGVGLTGVYEALKLINTVGSAVNVIKSLSGAGGAGAAGAAGSGAGAAGSGAAVGIGSALKLIPLIGELILLGGLAGDTNTQKKPEGAYKMPKGYTFGMPTDVQLQMAEKHRKEFADLTESIVEGTKDSSEASQKFQKDTMQKLGIIPTTLSGMPTEVQRIMGLTTRGIGAGIKGMKDSLGGMPTFVQEQMGLINRGIGAGIQGMKDSFGGMPSSVQNYMNQTNNVVTAASNAGSNQLKTSWGSGVQGIKDSFGGMPSSVQNYMNGLNNNITTATDAGMGALTGKTAAGTGTAKELYRNTVNSTSTYLEGLANNTNTALSSAFKTLNGMPSAIQKIMGINWSTFQATGSVSLPRFANGAFLRANQPQLAIVGDNRYEGEFVAPESKLVQAVTSGVQAALRALTPAQTAYSGAGGGDTNIYIGGRQITDYVVERTNRTNRLKGE